MIAGRLRWKEGPLDAWKPGKIDLAAFEFDSGLLTLTEASQKKRASLHIIQGRAAVWPCHAGGVDVLTCFPPEFAAAMRSPEPHRQAALTDPRTVDGIGNAYSDEILHAAKMPPPSSRARCPTETRALHATAKRVLEDWTARLSASSPASSPPGPDHAFRPDFAVHGRFGKPCPVCGAPIQRIVRAENEFNYCPGCQTGGRILADRSLSRLLKDDWPRTLEELEDA
jgi:formamidopyrimidine-DNA glycosylase